jgi:hypothetical protein
LFFRKLIGIFSRVHQKKIVVVEWLYIFIEKSRKGGAALDGAGGSIKIYSKRNKATFTKSELP